MNAKTIAAIKEIANLLYTIAEEYESSSSAADAEPVKDDTTKKTRTRKPATSRKASEEPTEKEEKTTEYTQEDLDAMSYNEIKKLAKSLGISAAGDRDTLVSKILGEDAPESDDESAAAPAKKGIGRKMTSKKSEPDPEPEDPASDEDDDLYAQVSEAVEGMETDEIIDLLTEAGVKVRKGSKRQTVLSSLVKAVEDGLIDLSDDGEEGDDESSDEETSARDEAVQKSNEDIDKQFEDGDITRDDLIEWYCEAYGEKPIKVKKMKDEALLDAYKEASALFIDDAGETHEECDPYEINGEPYCCGAPLKYNKDDNSYICEQCGSEYNAEE